MEEINGQLHTSFEKLRSFPGAISKHVKCYIVPSLIEETPNRIILHGVCNDANSEISAPDRITNEIADMVILSRDYGVNDIFISAMICRRGKLLNGKVKRVNFLLKHDLKTIVTLKSETYGKMVYIYYNQVRLN